MSKHIWRSTSSSLQLGEKCLMYFRLFYIVNVVPEIVILMFYDLLIKFSLKKILVFTLNAKKTLEGITCNEKTRYGV